MLCQLCQNLIFVPPEELDQEIPSLRFWGKEVLASVHHPSMKVLEASAGRGCRVCAMIWFRLSRRYESAYEPHVHHELDHKTAPIILLMSQPWRDPSEPQNQAPSSMTVRYGQEEFPLCIRGPVSDEIIAVLDLSCVLSSQTVEQSNLIGSAVDNHTGSTNNMDLIKTWLQACQKKHRFCKLEGSSKTPPPLPTRVVEIDIDGQTRITETQGIQAEYLTLSYCWGEGKKLLCTKGSGLYEQFKQRLPVDDSMPRTFKDALQVTRALGHRYLWIDALCIIQDDPEDVAKEMARMGDIYRQSVLTIFAANGPNTDAGLFAKRDARSCKSCNVQVTMKQGRKCVTRVVSIQPIIMDYVSALRKRGWVLQEEVLSGRLLAFGPISVDWFCVTSIAGEATPCMDTRCVVGDQKDIVRHPHERTHEAMRSMVRRPDIFSMSLPLPLGRRNHFDTWYEVASDYSARSLSVSSDRLLALGGLASRIQKSYGLTYAAGLWKEDLSVGLCWRAYSTIRGSGRTGSGPNDEDFPDYLAPTWSWASTRDTFVRFPTYIDRSDISEEEVQVVNLEVSHLPGPLGAFGHITSARLSIRARIRRMLLVPHQPAPTRDGSYFLPVDALDPSTKLHIQLVSLDSVQIYNHVVRRFRDSRMGLLNSSATEDAASQTACANDPPSNEFEAWGVPCYVGEEPHSGRKMGLLVLSSLDADKQEYRRIGATTLYGESCNLFMGGEREIIHIL